jgi:signal transduction histidine kinase
MLSQYENKKMIIMEEKVNLKELVIDAVSKSRVIAAKKNIKVILKLDEENPDDIFIKGDYRKLLNVFLNLLDNAIKYSNDNTEINCSVGVEALKDGHNYRAKVSVYDEGVGIAEDSLKNIFERFYRADTSRTRDESYSLGLGLSIVKAVIDAHGGSVEVHSKEEKGSVFTVYLPVYNA